MDFSVIELIILIYYITYITWLVKTTLYSVVHICYISAVISNSHLILFTRVLIMQLYLRMHLKTYA